MHRTQETAAPISQFRIVEHKLGFKPVIACSCGAVLDKNKDRQSTRAFLAEHELCVPKAERVVEVAHVDKEQMGCE